MRKNAMSSCAVLLAMLAAAAPVRAQEPVSPERHVGPRDVPFLQGDATILDISLRVTALNGEFDFASGADYQDLWNTGLGAGLSLAFMNEVDSGFHIGPYFQLSADLFMADEDVEVDDLMLARFTAGIAARMTFGPIFLEARSGLGAAMYTATEFEPIPGASVEIMEGSVHFAWEARGTFGAMIGSSSSLSISFGYEVNDGPNGSDESPGLEPRDLKNFVLSIGLSFQL